MTDNIQNNVERICKLLYEKKAVDIVTINITDRTIIADYFVICSGRSSVQIKALCDELETVLGTGLELRRIEGYAGARWIVMDFNDILVHIFHPEERVYYNIERLWVEGDNYMDYSATQKDNES